MNTPLTKIPGFGKKMAQHLVNIGYACIEDLKGENPEKMYSKHCLHVGPGDFACRCVLYDFRLAVCYADNDGYLPPDKQNWWNWKD